MLRNPSAASFLKGLRQYRCGPPPEFPLASPRSGIVHHLSGPDRHAHTRTLLRRSSRWTLPPAEPFPGFSGLLATSWAANRSSRRNPNTSPEHSIGRSDGRCVARLILIFSTNTNRESVA
ncbi:hypothetical protein ACH5RR_033811 [Cinchona calisaya]|uniref:Uncharacterized protein n=1 Tax=Cinchona calisaya TaxID=153742 RepID=A0ABD2YCN0_9GENT